MTKQYAAALALSMLKQLGLTDWQFTFDEFSLCSVRLSRKLVTLAERTLQREDAQDLLLHAIAHAAAGSYEHGEEFACIARRIGADPDRRCTKLEADYVASCPGCGKEFYRSKLPEKQDVYHLDCGKDRGLLRFA